MVLRSIHALFFTACFAIGGQSLHAEEDQGENPFDPPPEKVTILEVKEVPATQKSNGARVREALRKPVEVNLVEAPLREFVRYLKDRFQIEVQLDELALEDAGFDLETTITANVKGISLGSALELLLHRLFLDWVIDHEVLLITSREKAETFTIIRVYDVTDLIAEEGPDGLEKLRSLVELVELTIVPDSWTNFGGLGSIRPFISGERKVLAICQTDRRHRDVATLLGELRAAKDKPTAEDKD